MARLDGVPESLRERVLGAVRAGTVGSRLHQELERAAAGLLEKVVAAPPTRETALTLLAADALMTFACEAMAEEAPERLGQPQ